MPRYDISVLVRGLHDKNNGLMDYPIDDRVIAQSELEARKLVMERVWDKDRLVTEFLSIKQRSTT